MSTASPIPSRSEIEQLHERGEEIPPIQSRGSLSVTFKVLASTGGLWWTWIVWRLITVAVLLQGGPAFNDVNYYFAGIEEGGLGEYPVPSLLPVYLVEAWRSVTPQRELFVFVCLAMDALVAGHLIHYRELSGGPSSKTFVNAERLKEGRLLAVWFWCIFGVFIAPLMYARLDIFPAVLVAFSAVYLGSRPRVSSALLALATTIKLWPGVLAAGLVGQLREKATWVRLAWFGGSLLGIVIVVAASLGLDRVTSPISYQSERGLQVESVAATPFFLAHYFDQGTYEIDYAPSKSYEISGPGIEQAIVFTNVATAITLGLAIAWAVYRLLVGKWSPHSAALFFLAAITWTVCTNKVFSPQYMIWFGPLAAVLLLAPWESAADGWRGRGSRQLLVVVGSLLIIASGLSVYIYPFNYGAIIGDPTWQGAVAITLRNLIMIAVAILCTYLLVRESKGATRSGSNATLVGEESPPLHRSIGIWQIAGIVAVSGTVLRFLIAAVLANADGQSFTGALKAWDGAAMLEVAEKGYFGLEENSDSSSYFRSLRLFPGYPALVHLVHVVTRLPYGFAAISLNLALLWLLTAGVLRLCEMMGANRRESVTASVVFSFAPMAIAWNMPVAQVLFLALALWSLLVALEKDWPAAAALGFLASMVSPASLALAAGLAVAARNEQRRTGWTVLAPIATVAPTVSYLAWVSYQVRDFGGLLKYSRDEWGVRFDFGISTLKWIEEAFIQGSDVGYVLSATVIVFAPLLVAATRKSLPVSIWVFCAVLVAGVLLSTGIMHTRPRLLLPVSIALVPLAISASRKLNTETRLSLLAMWVLYGSWYSGHMAASFDWAI